MDAYVGLEHPGITYQMEKTQAEILEQGYISNFFECPYEF